MLRRSRKSLHGVGSERVGEIDESEGRDGARWQGWRAGRPEAWLRYAEDGSRSQTQPAGCQREPQPEHFPDTLQASRNGQDQAQQRPELLQTDVQWV